METPTSPIQPDNDSMFNIDAIHQGNDMMMHLNTFDFDEYRNLPLDHQIIVAHHVINGSSFDEARQRLRDTQS